MWRNVAAMTGLPALVCLLWWAGLGQHDRIRQTRHRLQVAELASAADENAGRADGIPAMMSKLQARLGTAVDPWGGRFEYRSIDGRPQIWSAGYVSSVRRGRIRAAVFAAAMLMLGAVAWQSVPRNAHNDAMLWRVVTVLVVVVFGTTRVCAELDMEPITASVLCGMLALAATALALRATATPCMRILALLFCVIGGLLAVSPVT